MVHKLRLMEDRVEARIQQECYIWFHNTFPELRGCLCYNLNNSKNKIDGSRNKSLGLQKGRSDMVLYLNGKAIMVEFKTPTGKQSQAQKKWQKTIEGQGFKYMIIRSKEEFKILITWTKNSH